LERHNEVLKRERGRKYSRGVDKVKNSGESEKHLIVAREEEHNFDRMLPDFSRSSF
jgi:hypothetical protein